MVRTVDGELESADLPFLEWLRPRRQRNLASFTCEVPDCRWTPGRCHVSLVSAGAAIRTCCDRPQPRVSAEERAQEPLESGRHRDDQGPHLRGEPPGSRGRRSGALADPERIVLDSEGEPLRVAVQPG